MGNNILDSSSEMAHVGGDLPPWRGYPWEVEPNRRWSLLDVIRLSNGSIFRALGCLQVSWTLVNHQVMELDEAKNKDSMDIALDMMNRLEECLYKDGLLSPSTSSLIRNTRDAMENKFKHDIGISGILVLIDSIRGSLEAEMEAHMVYIVPLDRRDYYANPREWFGEEIVDELPVITRDVRDAGRCYALGQWAAAIFHATRVLDLGLQIMAKRHGVEKPELLNRENLIEAIEDSITEIIQLRRPTGRQEGLLADSQAVTHLRFFKDRWGNSVSQPHADCDQQEAEQVLTHVKDFMGALAQRR